jgi:hypothetical protein
VLVDQGGGQDLVPVNIFEAQNDSILEISKKIADKVNIAKNRLDKAHNEVTKIATFLPSFLLGAIGFCGSYIGQNVGISVAPMNLKAN